MLIVAIYLGTLALLSVARTIPADSHDGIPMVTRGPYTVVNCSTANATKITNSLDNLAKYLTPAIQDAKKSSAIPSLPYTTFFKDRASASYISTLLTNVTTGPPMYQPNPHSNGAPVFACVQSPSQLSYKDAATNTNKDAYLPCEQNTTLASYIFSGRAYIVLCPRFFTTPSTQPGQPSGYPTAVPEPKAGVGANNCMNLDKSGAKFTNDGSLFTEYMPWLLLEEIAQYYITASSPQPVGPSIYNPATKLYTVQTSTTYDVNQCTALSPQRSIQNAHNYVYYVANIYAQCTSFPPPKPPTPFPQQQKQGKSTADITYPAGVLDGAMLVSAGGQSDVMVTGVREYLVEP